MIGGICRIGECHLHHVVIVESLIKEDVETTILESLDSVDILHLTAHFHSDAVGGIHQTLVARSLHEFCHIGFKTKVNLDDVIAELSDGTHLKHLELDIVEEELGSHFVLTEVESDGAHFLAALNTCLLSGDSALIIIGLPLRSEVRRTNHLIVDVITRLHMRLCIDSSINSGAIVEFHTILRSLGKNFGQINPELRIPVLCGIVGGLHHDATALVNTDTIIDDRRQHLSRRSLLGEEATHVVAFHVTVGDKVGPAHHLSLALAFEFHAGDGDICPVGTLDGMQVGEALLLCHFLQVNDVSLTLYSEEAVGPSTLRVLQKVRLGFVGIVLSLINRTIEKEARSTLRDSHIEF